MIVQEKGDKLEFSDLNDPDRVAVGLVLMERLAWAGRDTHYHTYLTPTERELVYDVVAFWMGDQAKKIAHLLKVQREALDSEQEEDDVRLMRQKMAPRSGAENGTARSRSMTTHRDLYPEQYTHELCGKTVTGKAELTGVCERVVPSRFGQLVILEGHNDNAYPLSMTRVVSG